MGDNTEGTERDAVRPSLEKSDRGSHWLEDIPSMDSRDFEDVGTPHIDYEYKGHIHTSVGSSRKSRF